MAVRTMSEPNAARLNCIPVLCYSKAVPMSQTTTEIRTATANGIRFAYLEEGKGPLVLMFHGFPDTAHTWDHVRPLIAAKGYRAVSPFMRGYRPTEVPARDADGDTLAHDPIALIEALGEKDAILVGHDWGAATVYRATALAPEKVRKLIAVAIPHSGTLKPGPKQLWGARHFFLYKLSGAPRRFAQNDFAALPAILKRWSPKWTPTASDLAPVRECFADAASLNAAFGYYRKLSLSPDALLKVKVSVPTVVFSGLDDPNVSRVDYERGQRMFEGPYTIEEMPGGHFLHLEHPEVFAEKLLKHF
jgi:pimeloyl-ACP methyl ester carboxylesterase